MDYKIPKHITGGKSRTSVNKSFSSQAEAEKHYALVKEKFFDINGWYYEVGRKKSKFYLCNETGDMSDSKPKKGDFIRIDVEGPDNMDGNGDDWVQITFMDEEQHTSENCSIIEVKPCKSPVNCAKEIAHFYDKDASNSFILRRVGKVVILEIHGRNEKINSEGATFFSKIRNILMGFGGIFGGSKSQWDVLAENLMKN